MNTGIKAGLAALAFLLPCLLPAGAFAVPAIKNYDFTRDSPSVSWTGGTADVCLVGSKQGGIATINFVDVYGGNTSSATFQTTRKTSNIAPNVVVNGKIAGALTTGSCCGCCVQDVSESVDVTSAYNNNASTKSVVIDASPGCQYTFWTITKLANTTDPMFRVAVVPLPGVSTPTTGGFTNITLPTISWAPLSGSTSYQLQIHTDPFFNAPYVSQTVLGTTQYTLTAGQILTNGVSYYARVRALGGAAGGFWSYVTDFTVAQTAPAAPTTVAPAANANVPVQTPTFNWSAVTSGPE